MSRQVSNLVGETIVIVFAIVAGGTPIVVLVLSILNFVRIKTRRVAIALKALAALAIWGFLTFVVVMLFIMVVFQWPGSANELMDTAIFVVGLLIYAMAGSALIYWMKRQSKLSQLPPEA
jgi:cytochrome bd-type quinol oxidase subunit 2